jgi:hypothetical protein
MSTFSHPHGRVGARHRAKLRKWSDKVARADETPATASSRKRPAVRRQPTLEAARKKLRRLFR